ncbi:uncharacterized protein LOC135809788 [Sycon ciliatum]|uniref:uncharacterized protein LOC135809788 n=1 Tax=Sycon ciliatum TaxID=27933 RepID=UPI0031F6C65C
MSLSVYALISVALLVLARPSDAYNCGSVDCPLPGYPDLTQCCSSSIYNTACCNIILAGWAIGVIVTGCILSVGGIFLCCLCCACCPLFQYRRARYSNTTYVTTTGYQSVPGTTGPTTTKVYS